MGRVLVYFVRFALIFVAYVCASLAASVFVHVLALGAAGVADEEIATGSLAFSVPAGALLISYFAFLPSIPAILLSEAFGWRDWLYYAVAGAVIATVAIFLLAGVSGQHAGRDYASARFWATMLGSGMFGGIVYWLVGGRLAGKWRTRARPPIDGNV